LAQNEGEPVKFIRELKEKSSVLIFYENQGYAKSLGFLFLDIGLKSGHACIYLSCEAAHDMESGMSSAGIDVATFKSENSLKIYNVTNQKKEQVIKIIDEFVKSARGHLRIIIHNDRFTRAQQSDLLQIAEFVQELFEKQDISVLNIYNTEFMDNSKFMQQIISMHEHTIFAPDFGKGIVIKMK
jgi:hypothetical protein